MPHLRPLENSEIQDETIVDRFHHYANTRGFTPNSIRTMARRPAIVHAFMALNQAVLYEGTVPEDIKMMVSLACSLASGCRYCQSHMANLSKIYNVPESKINQILNYELDERYTEPERAALNLAFKAGALPNNAEQADFDRLAKSFDAGEIVEIVASIALFGYLNRWNDTMATELEPLPKTLAEGMLDNWDAGKHV